MLEFICFVACIIFVAGLGHLPMIQAIFWYCDERDKRDVQLSTDMVLFSLVPLACVLFVAEIYFIFFFRTT